MTMDIVFSILLRVFTSVVLVYGHYDLLSNWDDVSFPGRIIYFVSLPMEVFLVAIIMLVKTKSLHVRYAEALIVLFLVTALCRIGVLFFY